MPPPRAVPRLVTLGISKASCSPAGTSKDGPCSPQKAIPVPVRLYVPRQLRPGTQNMKLPVVVFTPGFLIAAGAYESYYQFLVQQGYVVVAYDRRETALQPLSDADCVMVIRGLMDWVGGQVDVVAVANPRKALLVGHSRGARLSVLAATQDTRVKGLALIDPVDFSYEQRPGPDLPSAAQAQGFLRQLVPTLIFGAGKNRDCIPQAGNYEAFAEAAQPPALEVTYKQAGHFQFLDVQTTMQTAACYSGSVDEAVLRQTTQAAIVNWLDMCHAMAGSQMGSMDGQLGQAMEASGLAFLAQEAAQEINIQLKNSRLAYKMKLKA